MLHLIARIGVDKNNIIGYRILDSESKQTKDVGVASITNVLKSGVTVQGICLDRGRLKATNGSFERYPLIIQNRPVENKSSLVILFKVDGGFICSDYKGTVGKYRDYDVVKYSKKYGISNGKVVNSKGTEFISSINGEYIKLEEPKSDKKEIKSSLVKEEKQSNDIYNRLDRIKTSDSDRYRTTESYVAEILHKGEVSILENLTYEYYILLMGTAYAEERDLEWIEEEADATLVKREVYILDDNSFIIQYYSLKIIKARKKGLKLGKCYATAIYKDGVLANCFVHEKELATIFETVKKFYWSNKTWTQKEINAVKRYGFGLVVPNKSFIPLVDSGFWYTKNRRHVVALELGINRVDGCCYLAVSIYDYIKGQQNYNARQTRQFANMLKFKDLESGLAYAHEYLEKNFRGSIGLKELYSLAEFKRVSEYTEIGPITYLANRYIKGERVISSNVKSFYGVTPEELGLVHPDNLK